MKTTPCISANEANIARLALVLPVDAQITALRPLASACVIATVMPRSLNDPVGLAPSTFKWTVQPVNSDRCGAVISGVLPSPRVITFAPAGIGMREEYASMMPGQALVAIFSLRLPHASR